MIWTAFALNLALMYAILIGVNIPAPFLGLDFGDDNDSSQRLWYEAPGFVIPIAWSVLFALLALARYDVTRRQPAGPGQAWIVALAVLCASYAYYTLGLAKITGISALWFGLAGNLAVIAMALLTALRVRPVSGLAFRLVVPVAVWTVYATAIVLGQMRMQRLI